MSDTVAENLLTEAQRLYSSGQTNHRDAMLHVGRLLRQFVMARLGKCNRTVAVKDAADRLNTRTAQILRLIASAMVFELLSDGGEVGQLGYGAICTFQVCITRKGSSVKARKRNPLLAEEWEIRSSLADSAKALFRRAVSEKFTYHEARAEVAQLINSKSRPHRRGFPAKTLVKIEEVRQAAMRASPGDVADMCMQMVQASEAPWQVAQRLIAELQRIPRKKRDPLLFEVAV